MPQRIVLFGGTFDPVHNGHLIVARSVAEQRRFDRVCLVPSANPPHKASVRAPGADRLAMLRLAIEGEELFDVSDAEIRRQGPSYTIDTIAALRRQAGPDAQLHLIVGADMLADLPTWYRVDELVRMVRIVVAARPPWQQRMGEILAGLGERFPAEFVAQTAASVLPTPLLDISSTDVRRRVAEGRSIRYLVPEAVRQYILEHGIYGGGTCPQ